jgi:hypothetical protein
MEGNVRCLIGNTLLPLTWRHTEESHEEYLAGLHESGQGREPMTLCIQIRRAKAMYCKVRRHNSVVAVYIYTTLSHTCGSTGSSDT